MISKSTVDLLREYGALSSKDYLSTIDASPERGSWFHFLEPSPSDLQPNPTQTWSAIYLRDPTEIHYSFLNHDLFSDPIQPTINIDKSDRIQPNTTHELTQPMDNSAFPYEDNAKGLSRGRTALHRLIIEQLSHLEYREIQYPRTKEQLETESYDNMLTGIQLQREKFGILTDIQDEKGRTALHYVALLSVFCDEYSFSLSRLLLKISSNVNVIDDNLQTPLHFATNPSVYKYFVDNGANEEAIDKWGHTPKSLYQLRSQIGYRRQELHKSFFNVAFIMQEMLQLNYENETLSVDSVESTLVNNEEQRRNSASTSSRTETGFSTSLKEATIWKVYTKINGHFELISRLKCINIKLQDFVARLADAIGKRDPRFTCSSKLTGSSGHSSDGTKLDFPGDFDFDLNLVELSKCCEAVPSITTSSGYVHLRKNISSLEEENFQRLNFDELFNEDHLLLTNKVNCMFKLNLLLVLNDPDFWKTEDLFELDVINETRDIYDVYDNTDRLHSKIRIRMLHPIGDLYGDQVFFDTLSLDIVPSISAPGQCIKEALIDGERSKNCDYTLVFEAPQRFCPWVPFKDTFARVSFGVAETNVIRNCPSVLKAAYFVGRAITRLRKPVEHSYYLKTCLLYCIEAFETAGIKVNDAVTASNLYFWVERILFCYAEFFSQDFLPCYFMPSFSQPTGSYLKHVHMNAVTTGTYSPLSLFEHGIYEEICPTGFDSDINLSRPQPLWENFNREDFMKKLSKRFSNNCT